MRATHLHRFPASGRLPAGVVRPASYDWPRPVAEPDAFAAEVGAVMSSKVRRRPMAGGAGTGDGSATPAEGRPR